MRAKGKLRSRLLGSLLLAAALVGLSPVLAYAQAPIAVVSLWEIQEFVRFKPADEPGEVTRRLADAALVGVAVGGICPPGTATITTPIGSGCAVGLRATSRVDLTTGTGPISGTVNILADVPATLVPDPVLVAATGSLKGTLDLGPALTFLATGGAAGIPTGDVTGTWRIKELKLRGTLAGLFQIPVPSGACDLGFAYVNPTGALGLPTVQCLGLSDFSLGVPAIKFTAVLTAN